MPWVRTANPKTRDFTESIKYDNIISFAGGNLDQTVQVSSIKKEDNKPLFSYVLQLFLSIPGNAFPDVTGAGSTFTAGCSFSYTEEVLSINSMFQTFLYAAKVYVAEKFLDYVSPRIIL